MWAFIHENWLYLLAGSYPKGPLGGLAATVSITIVCLILSLPCAVLIALCRTSGIRFLVVPTTAFVYTIRGIPLLMLIFWIFFAAPVVLGFTLNSFVTIVIAITMFQSAYMSEVIRSGIEALPKGQQEAARSLGLRYFATTWKVVLPQALYNVLPGLLNNVTAIFKETSLAYAISLHEFTYAGIQVMNQQMSRTVEVFAVMAGTYFILSYALSRTARWLEMRIERKRAADTTSAPIVARAEIPA